MIRLLRPSCRVVGRMLQTYLDGELDLRRSLLVAAHLSECVNCGMDADSYRWLSARLAGLGAPGDTAQLDRVRAFAEGLTGEGG